MTNNDPPTNIADARVENRVERLRLVQFLGLCSQNDDLDKAIHQTIQCLLIFPMDIDRKYHVTR